MARKYQIELVLSTGDSEAKAARAAKAMGKIADAAANGATKATQAAQKTADQQVISYESLAVKHASYMTKRENAERKAADKSAAEARRAADAQQREGERTVSAAQRRAKQLEDIETRWLARAYKDRVRFEAMKERAEQRATAAAAKAAEASDKAAEAASKNATQVGKAASSGVALQTALGGVAAIAFSNLLKGLDDVTERIHAATEAALELRKDLRVDAALVGEDGPNDKVVGEHLALRARSGLGQREASDFNRQFEGSLPIGLQKGNIDRDTATKLRDEAATMAARVGGDAGTRGDLAGILAQFRKYDAGDKGVNQAMGDMEAVRVGLTAGRGDDTPLTNQLLKVAGSMVREGGPLPDIKELSALIGVTSLSAGPEAAATRAEQLSRGLKGSFTKHGQKKGAVMSRAEYAKSIGLDEKDSLEAMLDKIAPDLAKAQAAGRDPEVYLAERGFASDEERRAIIETVPNLPAFKQRLADARKGGQGDAAMKANENYRRSHLGQKMLGQAAGDAASFAQGKRGEALNAAAEAEAARSKPDEEGLGTYLGDFVGGVLSGHPMSAATAGRRGRLENQALNRMMEQARALKVPEEDIRKATSWQWGRDSIFSNGPDARDKATWLSKMITDRGGVIGAGARREALNQAGAAIGQPNFAAGAEGPDAGGKIKDDANNLVDAINKNTKAVNVNNQQLIAKAQGQQIAVGRQPRAAAPVLLPPRAAAGGAPGRS